VEKKIGLAGWVHYRINKVRGPIVNLGNNPLTSTIRLGNSCGGGSNENFNGYNDSYISKVEEYLSKKWSL